MALAFTTPRRRLGGDRAHAALETAYKGKSPAAENWIDMRPPDDDCLTTRLALSEEAYDEYMYEYSTPDASGSAAAGAQQTAKS